MKNKKNFTSFVFILFFLFNFFYCVDENSYELNYLQRMNYFKQFFFPSKNLEWPNFKSPIRFVENARCDNLRVYFVNHATSFIQINKYNILTDPVWSNRVGPFGIGPKRVTNPGLDINKLPKIDCIIISHNHYDHLDLSTLTCLRKKYPNLVLIVPNKVEKLLLKFGFKKPQVISLDWWEEYCLSTNTQTSFLFKTNNYNKDLDLKITCVPAKHFSGRGIFDRNKTLWAGFVIESNKYKVYFAGDTGFSSEMFNQISEKFNNFDISLIPIGAYMPRAWMQKVHIDPEEAVKIT